MHMYQAFGVSIGSEIALPELLPGADGKPDVVVCRGRVKPLQSTGDGVRSWYRGGEGWLQFEVAGVARFLVSDGQRIVVDMESDVELKEVRLYLLGSGLGAVLMQRGLLVLHGSSVVVRGRAVLFLGESGAGKSTLAAALRKKGNLLLSDDLCVVSTAGDLLVYPGYPQHKLWEDSLRHLEVDLADLQRVRPSADKRALPVERGFFRESACPLGHVFALSRSGGDEVEVETFSGGLKLASLLACRYRPQFVDAMKLEFGQFESLGRVAREIPLALIARPEGRLAVDELVARVLSDFGNED